EQLRLRSDGAATDRGLAVAEWCAYRETFASVDQVGLHLEKLEAWGGASLAGIVRFEAIGTPKGAPLAGVDRARVHIAFDRTGSGLAVGSASLLAGDRWISAGEQFHDVAHAAGVDFRNEYYPPFINEHMAFGMIRYGPGGISAVDYDNDGFYDLFIPDGVASKLLRNPGDGTFEDVTAATGPPRPD